MENHLQKQTSQRVILGLVQHTLIGVLCLVCALVLVNSELVVGTIYGGTRSYNLIGAAESETFEESSEFSKMIYDSVGELAMLAVIKDQMETDGVYDGNKLIDISDFAHRKELASGKAVSNSAAAGKKVSFYLNDLIKWGQYGLEYETHTMNKRDFITYFNPGILSDMSQYYYNSDAKLVYGPVPDEVREQQLKMWGVEGNLQETEDMGLYLDDYGPLMEKMEEAAFDYIKKEIPADIIFSVDENGELLVTVSLLKSRYPEANSHLNLQSLAGGWKEYYSMESDLSETINSLKYNYEIYLNHIDLYTISKTNLQYLFQMETKEGIRRVTNLAQEFDSSREDAVTDYFARLGMYVSYSLDDLSYEGNLGIPSQSLRRLFGSYEYAYPENTRIWIGLDTSYAVTEDRFAEGSRIFHSISTKRISVIGFLLIGGIVWIGLWVYLSYTAGWAWDEEGEPVLYLTGFDRVYTEFILFFVMASGIVLLKFANELSIMQTLPTLPQEIYQAFGRPLSCILVFTGGFLVSLIFCVLWYSLIRRIKNRNLFRDSLIFWILSKIRNGAVMVMYHHNTVIRTLIPYNLFLLVNIVLGFIAFKAGNRMLTLFAFTTLLFMDALIGVTLFRRGAEMVEIVEGITRIRQGDVEHKLEVERLHGENREIAEAVNNIGEGIRKAVSTSMRDERLKTELITNVSHDIKTPLTSIINYVDLLKREKIDAEPAKGYIKILDDKSQKLKQLAEDLVEVSRISSGNLLLSRERLDVSELVGQAYGEFSERFEEKELGVIFSQPETPAYILADSRRMWRVMQNLFNNACKYAMPKTRIYISVDTVEDRVVFSIKNISEQLLKMNPEELTERFIRGDESRTTEGTGLGLSIAKTLIEAQDGVFRIELDGDLFKAIVEFPMMEEPGATEEPYLSEEPYLPETEASSREEDALDLDGERAEAEAEK